MSVQQVDIADQTFRLSRSYTISTWVWLALFSGFGGYAAYLFLVESRPVFILFIVLFMTIGMAALLIPRYVSVTFSRQSTLAKASFGSVRLNWDDLQSVSVRVVRRLSAPDVVQFARFVFRTRTVTVSPLHFSADGGATLIKTVQTVCDALGKPVDYEPSLTEPQKARRVATWLVLGSILFLVAAMVLWWRLQAPAAAALALADGVVLACAGAACKWWSRRAMAREHEPTGDDVTQGSGT